MPLNLENFKGAKGAADVTMRAHREPGDDTISLFLLLKFPNGVSGAGKEVICHQADEGDNVEELMMLTPEAAQDLITDLWFAGARPEGVEFDCSGELKATKKHLEDTKQMMFAFWNKLQGANVTMGRPLIMKDPPGGGSKVLNPEKPEANTGGGKKK